MTINQLIKQSSIPLGLLLDYELLLSHILKKPKEFILGHPEFKLSKIQVSKFRQLWEKRLRHYPLAYITGHREFFGLDFSVNKDVLIPRPETEFLVEKIIENVRKSGKKKIIIADIGTGSGCIVVALKKHLTVARTIGLDTSAAALKVAKNNSQKSKTAVEFYRGDIEILAKKKIFPDIIVANLPYLDGSKKQFYYRKCPDLKYEPKSALFSDQKGLGDYIRLLEEIIVFKKLPVMVFLEIGAIQAKLAQRIFSKICSNKYSIKFNNYSGTAIGELIIKNK